VLANSFDPVRHRSLLARDPLPAVPPLDCGEHLWACLRELQAAYQAAAAVNDKSRPVPRDRARVRRSRRRISPAQHQPPPAQEGGRP